MNALQTTHIDNINMLMYDYDVWMYVCMYVCMYVHSQNEESK